jgi:hypothetical protein
MYKKHRISRVDNEDIPLGSYIFLLFSRIPLKIPVLLDDVWNQLEENEHYLLK